MIKFIFWAMSSHGPGISGGDRIYIEFAKRWSQSYPVTVVTSEEGIAMMARNKVAPKTNLSFLHISIPRTHFLISYILRILISTYKALTLNIDISTSTYIYSASEFWMDSLPCFILKIRFPRLIWLASWYQTAPSPFVGFGQGRYRWSALLLWLTQLPIKPLIARFADQVLVNNDIEKSMFKKSIVVLGAVDTQPINDWLVKNPKNKKIYSAVFQGRFHPQKGVEELVDIWGLVVSKRPSAKLVMIGDGPLMSRIKNKIEKLHLQNNISVMGFVFDGVQKYKIFSQSQLVVHPAYFDSGGMATAEAMAFNIPAIGFDLPAYQSYYPKGFLKVPIGNLSEFARNIIALLDDSDKRNSLGMVAGKFVNSSYTWEFRAKQILAQVLNSRPIKYENLIKLNHE